MDSYARTWGLTRRAAKAYATLGTWAWQGGYPIAEIVSGVRDASWQRAARARWDRGDRRGLVARPALDSNHVRGEAWDVKRGRGLDIMARYAPYAGVRWGGTFADRDEVHFDLGA